MLTGMNHLTLAVADLDRSPCIFTAIFPENDALHTRWKYGRLT